MKYFFKKKSKKTYIYRTAFLTAEVIKISNKNIHNIYIDNEVWNTISEKYPRQVSRLIEDYLRGLLCIETPEIVDDSEEKRKEIDEGIEKATKELRKLQSLKNAFDLDAEKKEKERRKKAEKELKKKERMVDAIVKSGAMELIK